MDWGAHATVAAGGMTVGTVGTRSRETVWRGGGELSDRRALSRFCTQERHMTVRTPRARSLRIAQAAGGRNARDHIRRRDI